MVLSRRKSMTSQYSAYDAATDSKVSGDLALGFRLVERDDRGLNSGINDVRNVTARRGRARCFRAAAMPEQPADMFNRHAKLRGQILLALAAGLLADRGHVVIRQMGVQPLMVSAWKRLQMIRANTPPVLATVVNIEVRWNRATHLLIRKAVRVLRALRNTNDAVAIGAGRSHPLPASACSNLIAQHDFSARNEPRVMTSQKPSGLTLDIAALVIRADGKRGSITTAALTKTVGDVWDRILVHRLLLTTGAMAGDGDTSPGRFLPRLYQIPPETSEKTPCQFVRLTAG